MDDYLKSNYLLLVINNLLFPPLHSIGVKLYVFLYYCLFNKSIELCLTSNLCILPVISLIDELDKSHSSQSLVLLNNILLGDFDFIDINKPYSALNVGILLILGIYFFDNN